MSVNLDGKRILWAEDRFDTLVKEREALEACGAQVTYVVTVNAAFEELQKSQFDLVILDSLLPQADPLPQDLMPLQIEAGLVNTESYGLVLALWLVTAKSNVRFFFYTIIPDAADQVLRTRLDPKGNRFVDKGDQKTWGEQFPITVIKFV
jgi:hypothetical protein